MRRSIVLLTLAVTYLISAAASAQWPSDSYVNLPIADRVSEQVVPKIAAIPGGGCYVGWYDLSFGVYAVCLQRLDAAGREMWPHYGVTVSVHPQLSYVTDWSLLADSEGNAVLVFSDARTGTDLDVQAYRVAADGRMLWGSDGISLSMNADYEPAPVVTEASDGDFVFAWPRMPDAGGGTIQMQRVSPGGELRFPPEGLAVVSSATESPAWARLVGAEDGSVIMIWVRDIHSYTSPRHIRAQKFSAAGAPIWPAVVSVYDAYSVPMGYGPDLYADEANGAIVLWHAAAGDVFNTMVQHLNPAGVELFPHNGVTVSTAPTRHHLDPALVLRADTGEIFVVFNERNYNQTQWGIYGQKFTADGTRAWGAEGRAFITPNSVTKNTQRAIPCGDGIAAFFIEYTGGQYAARVLGFRVDALGNSVWSPSFREVSSRPASKARLPVAHNNNGMAMLVWEDGRADFADVYGQNVNPDGSLGVDPAAVAPALAEGLRLAQNAPNPFYSSTRFTLPTKGEVLTLRLTDAGGRVVRLLNSGRSGGIEWDGRDEHGRALPAGTYFFRVMGAGEQGPAGRAILLR